MLKIISNKINRNKKKGDLIWHIKKLKEVEIEKII